MPDVGTAARAILDYLAQADPLPAYPYDAVMGFGAFDLRLPGLCGDLYARGAVRKIIFTGGIGAGTGTLRGPEADVWLETLAESHPAIAPDDVIVENRSTNTAENVSFTAAVLAARYPDWTFGRGIRRLIAVASPSRLRRVRLTLARLVPAVEVIGQLPPVEFDFERQLYHQQGIDYLAHLAGEIDRIVTYGERGWIVAESLPEPIARARASLAEAPQVG